MQNPLLFTARLNYIIQILHTQYYSENGYIEFSALGATVKANKTCALDIDERELQLLLDMMLLAGVLREGTEYGYYTFCYLDD